MEPLPLRGRRASGSPTRKAEKNMVNDNGLGSNFDNQLLKCSIQNSVHRAGTFSTRSDTPSTNESVWDHNSAVCSVASSATSQEYWSTEIESHTATHYKRHSDGEDDRSDEFRIPEHMDVSNSSISDENSGGTPFKSLADNYQEDNFMSDLNRFTNISHQSKLEDTGSELEDDDFDSDDEDQDDDGWGGEPDRIESAVLANVEDLGLAAWLIVELHKDQVHNEAGRIGGWQRGVINCQNSPESGETPQQPRENPNTYKTYSKSRKRQRLSGSQGRGSDDGDGEERDDGEGNGSSENRDDCSASGDLRGRYACPFNKSDPSRFCSNPVTGDQYRICESGFKTIQRLKEHIKRKHLLIQCERCYKNFSGKGKSVEDSLVELRRHRQQPESCPLGNIQANTGISMEQWTLLDKSGGKKRQKTSDVEKWFSIWKTIYPGIPHPLHPWAERTTPGIGSLPAPANMQGFGNLFQKFLDHGTMSGDIQFIDGQDQVMKTRMNSLALKAYNVHMDMNGTPSFGDSSSSGQTATQTTMPTTPSLSTSNLLVNTVQRQIPSSQIGRHRSQPVFIQDSQTQFTAPHPRIQTAMPYGSHTFHSSYGRNQLPRVSRTPLISPSQDIVLEQPDYNWPFDAMSQHWPELELFEFPLQVNPENQDMLHMKQNPQS
ncbi:hypothetical protein F4804DRAFT_317804 [Jackrogersella minutella]|nr:hypothetical protein F4804DRAFT_317804 [Jackrogersella minutella]